jgi:hypothetical protein
MSRCSEPGGSYCYRYRCRDCGREMIHKGQTVKCQHCGGYVPFGTRLCECGYKRQFTYLEAAAERKVEPNLPEWVRTNSSVRKGACKAPAPWMVAGYRMDSGMIHDHEDDGEES